MKTHRIIRDQSQFEAFIDWLPGLKHNECFYLCLQARRKYMPSLSSSDKTQLRRFIATKQTLARKVAELECPVGVYRNRDGEIIPDEAIALYVTVNPRCLRKATYATAHAMLANLQNHDTQETITLNPHSESLTQIHKARARSALVHFDVDMPTGQNDRDASAPKSELTVREIHEKTTGLVGADAVEVITTRGGCHVLINPAKVVCEVRNWYPVLASELNVDQTGDMMVPVVGCCQGGFVPHFYSPS